MAQFIDERQDEETEEHVESFEEQVEDSVEEQPKPEESDIPEKYRNKSVKDIIAMHQNAEQLLGKQGQEVGELRRAFDDFIKTQTVSKQETAQSSTEEVDDLEFFENPKAAINKMLENHPSVQESKQAAVRLKQQEVTARLQAAHPDYASIVQDPKFAEWIQKSKVRTRLLQEADKGYDFDAADELLTTWKERKGTLNTTVAAEQQQRKQQVKSASSGTSRGSAEAPTRKIYRRQDIIELMRKDPDRYEALMPEIRAAYAEGRVK
jgi:hypothetical protein